MDLSGIMGSFMKWSEWIMKFLVTNLIWLLFNFPILYFALDMFFERSMEKLYMLLLTILLMLPWFFFPATTAMFAVVRRWVVGKEDGRLLHSFWKYYKQNYVRSLAGSFVFLALWLLWIVNYRLSMVETGSGLYYFYIAVAIVFTAFTNYFFADTVHFEIKLLSSLRKALFMALFHIHYTLGAAAASFIAIFILYKIHPIFVFLFSGSTVAYIYFFAYHQIFLKAKGVHNTESL